MSPTRFALEMDLVDALLEQIKSLWPDCQSRYVFTEVSIGAGVADVVLAVLDEDLLAKRLEALPIPIKCDIQISILSALHPRKPLSAKVLAAKSGLSMNDCNKHLQRMFEAGWVEKIGNGFVAVAFYKPLFKRLISLEVKLSDWKRALEQASRNLLFSTQSFVALDAASSGGAKQNRERFKRSEVGLLTADKTEQGFKVVYGTRQRKPISPFFSQLANEVLLEHISQGRHTVVAG